MRAYLWVSSLFLLGSVAMAADNDAMFHEGPCKQIKEACEKAGFVKGEAKDGKGLHVDCIHPLMHGTPQPAKAVLKLPTVDPSVIAACKQKHEKNHKGQK